MIAADFPASVMKLLSQLSEGYHGELLRRVLTAQCVVVVGFRTFGCVFGRRPRGSETPPEVPATCLDHTQGVRNARTRRLSDPGK